MGTKRRVRELTRSQMRAAEALNAMGRGTPATQAMARARPREIDETSHKGTEESALQDAIIQIINEPRFTAAQTRAGMTDTMKRLFSKMWLVPDSETGGFYTVNVSRDRGETHIASSEIDIFEKPILREE